MSDTLSVTYLYAGAVALLTNETRLIIHAITQHSTFGDFASMHATSRYMWAVGGSLAITAVLLWFTGVQLTGWSSGVLITVLGLFGGVLTFQPVDKVKPKPLDDIELAKSLVDVNGKKLIDLKSVQDKNVREALYQEKGFTEDEESKKAGVIVSALKRQILKVLPAIRNTAVRAIDGVVMEAMGYESERYVVLPESRSETVERVEELQQLDVSMSDVLDEVVKHTDKTVIIMSHSKKINGVALLEKVLEAYKTNADALGDEPLKVLRALYSKYSMKFFTGKQKPSVDNDFRKKQKDKAAADKLLGELMALDHSVNPVLFKEQMMKWMN